MVRSGYDAETLRGYLARAESALEVIADTHGSQGRADTGAALVHATAAFVQAHVAVNRMEGEGTGDEAAHELIRQLAENTGILATAV